MNNLYQEEGSVDVNVVDEKSTWAIFHNLIKRSNFPKHHYLSNTSPSATFTREPFYDGLMIGGIAQHIEIASIYELLNKGKLFPKIKTEIGFRPKYLNILFSRSISKVVKFSNKGRKSNI